MLLVQDDVTKTLVVSRWIDDRVLEDAGRVDVLLSDTIQSMWHTELGL